MSLITCSKGHENSLGSHFCYSCGESLPAPEAHTPSTETGLLPGTRLRDRYIIQRQLSQGGFGSTYLAEDTARFNELVALKELTPVDQGTDALEKAEELFQREAVMLHRLQHPQIPRFWEFFRDDKRLFLVQDYIEGQTYESLLNKRLALGQRFSEAEIIQLLRQLLPVLSYLHQQGVIHRDISPNNIIHRSQDGLPVLTDLGGIKQIAIYVATQAAQDQDSNSNGGTRLGKSGYSPDEQLHLGTVAPHSDLYALGVTAVVLMTRQQPQQLIEPQTRNWVWNQQLSLSPHLNMILQRMLAIRPSERFQSADEILQQLETNSEVPETLPENLSAQDETLDVNSNAHDALANNSGQGHIFDKSIPVPDEIQGWNWGAFLLPGFWPLTNKVWIGLIAWVDLFFLTGGLLWLAMGVILGIKGNEWAWKSRRWSSISAFKTHQKYWANAGFIFLIYVLLLVALIALAFALLFGIGSFTVGN